MFINVLLHGIIKQKLISYIKQANLNLTHNILVAVESCILLGLHFLYKLFSVGQ